MAAAAKPAKPAYELSGWERFKKDVVRDKWLYLLILPGMLFMLIFRYIPIFGNVIAFMDFNPYNMWNSTWVGFDQFIKLFNKPAFMQTFYNTLYISILKMVCGFPIPITRCATCSLRKWRRHSFICRTSFLGLLWPVSS